ncbi:MAG: ABC transporter ATP-binding protein [Syntrophomonas sp.]
MKIKTKNRDTFICIRWIMKNTHDYWPCLALIVVLGGGGSLSGVAIAIVSKNMVDNAISGNIKMASIYAALFAGTIIVNLGLNVVNSLLSVRILESLSNSIRQRIYKQLTAVEWLPLSAYHSGDLLTRLTSDVGNVGNIMVNSIPAIVSLGLQLTAAFLTLLFYEPNLAILAFLLGPAAVSCSRIWGRKLKQLHIKVQESESRYRSYIQEALQNLLIIKCFQLETVSPNILQDLHEQRMSWVLKRNRTTLGANTTLGFSFSAGYFLAFVWGAYKLSQKAISFGTLTAFLQLVAQVQGPFIGLSRTFPQLIAAMASVERLMELEALQKEKKLTRVPARQDVGMCFHATSFSYHDKQHLLDKISVEIHPGEIVALIGSSGEGKTTMVRLLLAMLNPDEGQVFFTDKSGHAYQVSAATRDWISFVPQGNTLFSGTIADNLRSGKPDATEEEMIQATRAACAWNFIKKLPRGLDTVIGEGGLGISEGQAQRVAIARAFLRGAPILIMDEATSALDTETENRVLNAVKNSGYCCTCLIITHRPSVLKICSRILKIQNGVLVEQTA